MSSSPRRVVGALPLTEIWDANGTIAATRGARIGDPEIRALLQKHGAVQFVVADAVGAPLRWIAPDESRTFWRFEVRPRIVLADATRFEGQNYPGRYCYAASAWKNDSEDALPIVVLERYR